MCAMCEKEGKFKDNTSVGVKYFCSEKCWAEYIGDQRKPEGYYGMVQKKVGWWA